MAKFDSYVICTSPRSGSTLLCRLLAATGVAGNPASYFHRPSISSWLRYFKLTADASATEHEVLANIVNAAIVEGTCGTEVFGLRLQRHSFDFFAEKLTVLHPDLSNDVKRFHAAFGRTTFLYLYRQDKLAQAVSYVKAEQSGLWHMAADGTELERLSPPQPLKYDRNRIEEAVKEAKAQEYLWQNWFLAEGIEPYRITYESLAANPAEILSQTLKQLGLSYQGSSDIQPDTAKMADKTSLDWLARFRSGE